MSAYNCFVKNITNLNGRSIASSGLRILSGTIRNDAITKATSQFEVVSLPSAARIGDVIGVYDEYGVISYLGVINDLKGNTIGATQIQGIFDDNWLYKIPTSNSIEDAIRLIIRNDFQRSADTLLASIFSQFTLSTISTTNLSFPEVEGNNIKNMQSFIYECYESYGILTNISIPFGTGTSTINIGRPNYEKLILGNNTDVIRNFEIIKETQENNKLVIYNRDGTTLRQTYYATSSGITTDSSSLNRLPKINTVFVFSDDPLNDVVAQNLRNEMYNHKITFEAVLNNKLFNFNEFRLGQAADIYYNGQYYDSVLTGFELDINESGVADIGKFTFGLVRNSLTNKLYKLYAS